MLLATSILMIVDDLNVGRIAVAPVEADPPLQVNPHAILSMAFATKLFESVAWTRQVAQFLGSVEDAELSQRDTLDLLR